MTSLHRPRVRRGRIGVTLAALTGLLATYALSGTALATPDDGDTPVAPQDITTERLQGPDAAGTTDAIPGVGEVVTSRNVTHVANVPKNALQATNSDLAFQDHYVFAGNYDGFVIHDISRPSKPKIVAEVLCPGGQGDISVSGDLLFLSVDSSRSDDSCNSVAQSATIKDSWEGIRIFDISDKRNPKYVSAVETYCGSHTNTLVPDGKNVYVYVSSYYPDASFPDCQPPHNGISIVKVPRHAPERAEVSSFEVLFPDGGFPGSDRGSATSGCHDITAYPRLKIAAGACMGDGILMDISKPAQPRVIDRVQDAEHFAFWHSATFSQDGKKVVFTDELGGGGGATCNARIGDKYGANGIYHITGKGDRRRLEFQSYFKIPRHQADTENCVAHNGSLIPVRGRDIMVQSWYQGGVSIWEFTDSDRPEEIGYFDRGPVSNDALTFGGSWSAYYYNGYIYSNDQQGLDVLRIDDPRTNGARGVKLTELNAQTQPSYW